METMMEILAEEFTAAGHQVTVVTQVASRAERDHDYDIVRLPSLKSCVQLLRSSDVCLSANVSLRGLGPIAVAGTPLVISHQAPYGSPGRFAIIPQLKKGVTRFSENICCSQAVQAHIPGRSIVIPNTYRNDIFKEYADVSRDCDIVFVGRLVSDKGVADLIDALGHLGRAGFRPSLSIVGEGPERAAISQKIEKFGLGQQVTLSGAKHGYELARFIARHRVMAVPSRWAEPFGIVALEGIACGCAVVGTSLGGLPEAIGPCGLTVPNSDAGALAQALKTILLDEGICENYRSRAQRHLARHSRCNVARSYLSVLERVAERV